MHGGAHSIVAAVRDGGYNVHWGEGAGVLLGVGGLPSGWKRVRVLLVLVELVEDVGLYLWHGVESTGSVGLQLVGLVVGRTWPRHRVAAWMTCCRRHGPRCLVGPCLNGGRISLRLLQRGCTALSVHT